VVSFAGVRQALCERCFKLPKRDIRWFDVVGIGKLRSDWPDLRPSHRNVKIELSTQGTVGSYEALVVSIVDVYIGEIDRKVFHFRDYIEPSTHVWECMIGSAFEFAWYGFYGKDADTEGLMSAVDAYIRAWVRA
jgi:hypothetical protein